jgi:hypothetical protein
LVQRATGSATSDGAHFVVVGDFWVYVVVTLPLMGITMLLMVWMKRRAAKVFSKGIGVKGAGGGVV